MLGFGFLYRVYARINWFFYRVFTFKKNLWKLLFPEIRYERFFWDRIGQTNDTLLSHVPEDSMHIEQWLRNDGAMRRYVTYSMNPIQFYEGDPFAPVMPSWLWIGNPNDDSIDVTEELEAYRVSGNRITRELIEKVTGIEDAYYMDPRTLSILKFPEEGIVLKRDDSV